MKKILIVLPTYNEEKIVKENTLKVADFCQQKLKDYDWQILVADNGSTDRTPEIAKELSENNKRIIYFHTSEKGRGRTLKKAWREYQADFYSYMDIDLSSDLNSFPLLLKTLEEESYQIAIGSRLKKESKTERSLLREILSQGYNLLLKIFFNPSFEDAQCGFKAVSKEVVQEILSKVKNNQWFFDTEFLVLAEKAGYKIKEIPVEWIEKRIVQRKSKVKILATVWEDLKGMVELKIRLLKNKKN